MQRYDERELVILENQGQRIFGMLHLPLLASKTPVVMMCHGFAGNKIGKYRIYVNLAERLAKAGIASLRFDFRGSGESEGDFSTMTIESEISDALAGLQFLRTHPRIDSERIGLLGNSFGGPIAVMTAQRDGNIRSLVLLAALFNSSAWQKKWQAIHDSSSGDKVKEELARALDGHIPGPNFYKEFFQLNLEQPLKSLENIPLLHIHSEHDERVGLDQAELYRHGRQHAKAETRWMRLHKCNHDFSNAEERALLIEAATEWFSKTL